MYSYITSTVHNTIYMTLSPPAPLRRGLTLFTLSNLCNIASPANGGWDGLRATPTSQTRGIEHVVAPWMCQNSKASKTSSKCTLDVNHTRLNACVHLVTTSTKTSLTNVRREPLMLSRGRVGGHAQVECPIGARSEKREAGRRNNVTRRVRLVGVGGELARDSLRSPPIPSYYSN